MKPAIRLPSPQLIEAVDRFPSARVLCIGDVMLDRFIYGAVDRISPEAPIPVISVQADDAMPGGAGNVVRNILALGAHATFISVIGDDKAARDLTTMIGQEKGLLPYLLVETGRTTTQKTRYIAGDQQMLRADRETREPIRDIVQHQILEIATAEIPNHDVVVLSDYGKGVLTREVIQGVIAQAHTHGKPVLVDPKGRNFSIYEGAFVITPNLHELAYATARDTLKEKDLGAAATQLMEQHHFEYVLVTRGKEGMTLISKNGEMTHIPAQAREVYDVSGAGDTAMATLAVAYGAKLPLSDAASLANVAAGIVVGKVGTAVVHAADIKTALYTNDMKATQSKILPLEVAVNQVATWKHEQKTIGFTNGCFDLMHPGHLSLLHKTKATCDKLIVGLNSDASVKRLKGKDRPINGQMERAMLLASLAAVDLVVIFEEDTPLRLIESLKPDILAKGADYTKDQVVGADLVESYGGSIVLIPLEEGYSTTKILSRIG